MKVKKMGITEILRRNWLFSANKIKKSSESPTQLIIAAHNCHISFTAHKQTQFQIIDSKFVKLSFDLIVKI